jgi:hypothetical protein
MKAKNRMTPELSTDITEVQKQLKAIADEIADDPESKHPLDAWQRKACIDALVQLNITYKVLKGTGID